jgi:hypothetical protein
MKNNKKNQLLAYDSERGVSVCVEVHEEVHRAGAIGLFTNNSIRSLEDTVMFNDYFNCLVKLYSTMSWAKRVPNDGHLLDHFHTAIKESSEVFRLADINRNLSEIFAGGKDYIPYNFFELQIVKDAFYLDSTVTYYFSPVPASEKVKISSGEEHEYKKPIPELPNDW